MVAMFENFKRGWALFKTSFAIVKEDKSLMLLPLLSGLIQLVIVLTFIMGIGGVLVWVYHMTGTGLLLALAQWIDGWYGIAVLVLLSFAIYFPAGLVSIYFNSALVACATKRLEGGHPTVLDGLRMANLRKGLIIKWALLSTGVSLALTLLGTIKIGKGAGAYIGRVLQAGLGIAWSICIYFVVPVIVNEGLSPRDAIKRSGYLIKNNWGEALGGSLGSGLVFGALMLVGFAMLIGGIFWWAITGLYIFFILTIVLAMIYWMVLGLIASAVNTVLLAALYKYATTGQQVPGFDWGFFQNPWIYSGRAKKVV